MPLRHLFTRILQLFRPHPADRTYPPEGASPGPWSDASYQPAGGAWEGDTPEGTDFPGEPGGYEQQPPTWPTLTARELEVAWYLQQGMSNEAIANQLGISIATVKTHVHNLLVKFNVRSRWVLYEVLRNAPFDPWDQS